ncbi:MAG: hypothetical protein KF770_13380 [Anaerolineae bacterium]|nr:hypothetical protein [Anaerolineae bacterium]
MEQQDDQQFLFANLQHDHVRAAVWRAWERLPEMDRAWLRICNLTVHDEPCHRTDSGGFAISLPPGAAEIKKRRIWLNPELGEDDLVNVAGHEFAHTVLRHSEMKDGRAGAWQLDAFMEQQGHWLAVEVWGFTRAG